MIFRSPNHKTSRSFSESSALHLHKRFQTRYVTLLTGSLFFSTCLFVVTAFYFTQENYQLFKSLAFDVQPSLVRHIERESQWLLILLVLSLAATCFSAYRISVRMTSHLIEPLVEMERHMRQLVAGRWEQTHFRFSESADFKDLSMTYDYLLHMLKSLTEQELEMMLRMRLDPREKETVHIWIELINQKRSRLNLEPLNVTSLMTDVKPDLRRVS